MPHASPSPIPQPPHAVRHGGDPMTDSPASPGLVAIVGIGCRLPGADDPQAFFRNLAAGRDAVRRAAPHAEAPSPPSVPWTRWRSSMRASSASSPAMLSCWRRSSGCSWMCWWALEDAGYVPDTVPGSVGVFVAAAKSSYRQGAPRNGRSGEWPTAQSGRTTRDPYFLQAEPARPEPFRRQREFRFPRCGAHGLRGPAVPASATWPWRAAPAVDPAPGPLPLRPIADCFAALPPLPAPSMPRAGGTVPGNGGGRWWR